MRNRVGWLGWLMVAAVGCGNDDARPGDEPEDEIDSGTDAGRQPTRSGDFLALTYNVAGLPEGLSSSMPERFTPLIGPLLNDYELVLLQESWQTPDPNPMAPTRVYHEILVAASDHPYKSEPAPLPLGMDESRPSALVSDGLNMFSDFAFDETLREPWATCVESASDCLALKGFSMARTELAAGVFVDIYNLHMEAGGTPEDDTARDQGIDQLVAFIQEHSTGEAVIVGGDFNLHTDREPAATQFARLLAEVELTDACTDLNCDHPGSIDKFLFRSSDELAISAESWALQSEVFVSDEGDPLSDHEPLAVRFAWSAED